MRVQQATEAGGPCADHQGDGGALTVVCWRARALYWPHQELTDVGSEDGG